MMIPGPWSERHDRYAGFDQPPSLQKVFAPPRMPKLVLEPAFHILTVKTPRIDFGSLVTSNASRTSDEVRISKAVL